MLNSVRPGCQSSGPRSHFEDTGWLTVGDPRTRQGTKFWMLGLQLGLLNAVKPQMTFCVVLIGKSKPYSLPNTPHGKHEGISLDCHQKVNPCEHLPTDLHQMLILHSCPPPSVCIILGLGISLSVNSI